MCMYMYVCVYHAPRATGHRCVTPGTAQHGRAGYVTESGIRNQESKLESESETEIRNQNRKSGIRNQKS